MAPTHQPKLTLQHWRGDLAGGFTAAVVALPLALAFGVASGAGALAGLYGAIVLGFLAALLGGTATQVSGPTGPMTVVMTGLLAVLTRRYGIESALPLAFGIAALAGVLQVLMGVLRLGQTLTFMPYTVISGFMSGIGVIIVILQLPPLLGLKLSGSVPALLMALPSALPETNGLALLVGGLSFVAVMLYPRRWSKVLPSPLVVLVVGTLLSVFALPIEALPRLGPMASGLPQLAWPRLPLGDLQLVISGAITLALLGSLDTLLTSLVADSVTRTDHDSDRELIGQGIGNTAAALLGGLPGAGATMRTVVNVQAGGRTRLSGITHAVVLLLICLGAGTLASPIPLALLAGILLKVGFDIIDWSFLLRAPRLSMRTTALMWLVLVLTVFWDLITAVLVGMFLANLFSLQRQNEQQKRAARSLRGGAELEAEEERMLSPQEQELLGQAGDQVLLLQMSGPLSFGAGKVLSQKLNAIGAFQTLILDLSDVSLLGVTAALAIETLCLDSQQQGRTVVIVVSADQPLARLDRMGVPGLPGVSLLSSRHAALQQALSHTWTNA
jgi:sulfate permease, SulP family